MQERKPTKRLKLDVKKWFEKLDHLNAEPFFPDRQQPITPKREIFDQAPADPHLGVIGEIDRRD